MKTLRLAVLVIGGGLALLWISGDAGQAQVRAAACPHVSWMTQCHVPATVVKP